MAHALIDPQPSVAGAHSLVIHHNADWSGYAEIAWRWTEDGHVQRVSIRGPWLLQGYIHTEHGEDIAPDIAARAVALACTDHAIQLCREATESLGMPKINL